MRPPEKVRVIAEHIAKGEPRMACDCPIALAICDAAGVEDRAAVGLSDVDLWPVDADRPFVAVLPPEAEEFVRRFDKGLPVEPLEFSLTWEVRL